MAESLAARLRQLLQATTPTAYVLIAEARGSTPREAGAAMLVTGREIAGTVGGGRMEWDAVAHARTLLDSGESHTTLSIPLGPSIGQCCGGLVRLRIERADAALLCRIEADTQRTAASRPAVLLFGAGHVGRALAQALAPLPLAVRWIDARREEFSPDVPATITAIVSHDWESEIAGAGAGTACLVLTHSHALDSLIAAAALERDDFCHVGLIGSHTKRRQFEHGFRDIGMAEHRIARLVCPIGGGFARDKRPEVIAAFAAAELLQASLLWPAEPAQESRLRPLSLSAAR